MKKKAVTVLIVIILILLLLIGGAIGYFWYQETHIFVEDAVYPVNAQTLDLREQNISIAHYDEVHRLLPNCEILWMVPFQGEHYSSDTTELTLKSLSREDMELLMTYLPELRSLDASAVSDYSLLEEFQAAWPQCQIRYQVDLGGTLVLPDTEELVLEEGTYTLEKLNENLLHLSKVSRISFPRTELSNEQIASFREAYPQINVVSTVMVLGQELPRDTGELDLSDLTDDQVEDAIRDLQKLTELARVELLKNGKSSLEKASVLKLAEAMPGVVFNYCFELFGQTLNAETEEVIFKNQPIGNEGVDEIRKALDLMPLCKRMVLDSCRISNDVLAQLREDYRDRTKIVWRVYFGEGGTSLTDATAIRAVGGLVDDNCHDLVYCEDVVYMDIGHDEYLDACDFIAGMPNLRYLIISGSPIKSLEPFRNCKKLKFLELAFCMYITDASPLAECTSLEMLNISNTGITDLSPLDDLPLTHMVAVANDTRDWIPAQAKTAFEAKHPNCWTRFGFGNPYTDPGWRYASLRPDVKLPYYQQICDVFMYSIYPNCPNNIGWYYEEKTKWTVKPAEEEPESTQETAEAEASAPAAEQT